MDGLAHQIDDSFNELSGMWISGDVWTDEGT